MNKHFTEVDDGEPSWDWYLRKAISGLLNSEEVKKVISDDHIRDTPDRVVKAFEEYFSGVHEDPEEVLTKGFEVGTYNQMIFVKNISFVSFCAHHITPITGRVHFAYLPKEKIVGLSKIPRLIEIYARRPQVQEKMTQEIVDTFQNVVRPDGCGAVVEAVHLCMTIRGVRKENAVTRTTALKGVFTDKGIKDEFLDGIKGEHGWF